MNRRAFFALFGGFSAASLSGFAPAKAEKPVYLVGSRGPELIVPHSPKINITPPSADVDSAEMSRLVRKAVEEGLKRGAINPRPGDR
jgi:hypothetical protein